MNATTTLPARDVAAALVAAVSVDDETLSARRNELIRRAAADGLVDVAYRIVDSPFGSLLLAGGHDGLLRIAFESEGHDEVLARLANDVSPRLIELPARLDDAARQLAEYFDSHRRDFELTVDLRLAHGFRRTVLEQLRQIDYGSTRSYAEVAAAAGKPTAVRAAGSACSHNPLPLVVPCHRVVRSDGSIGNYLGGRAMKEALLAMEESAA